MKINIEFLKDQEELRLPIVRLTKSRNYETGTATFIFIKPTLFNLNFYRKIPIQELALCWNNKKIITTDLQIFFYKGNPFLIKAIFIFKNPNEWFQFLNFMKYYSQETGLFFTEIISTKNNL